MSSGISFYTEIILVLSAFLNAAVIYPVFSKLRENERSNMASFRLNPEDTLRDFKGFFAVLVFFTVATSFVLLGDITGSERFSVLGDLLSIISSFLPLAIFERWRRRFL